MLFEARADKRSVLRSAIPALLVWVAISLLISWQVSQWTRHSVLADIAARSANTLNLVAENLRGELAKFRNYPQLLATTKNFAAALKGDADAEQINRLNRELERINAVSGALDIYLMDATGLTVAASNWASSRPFVGKNFNYRPYFQDAMKGKLGQYFALGTTSEERGYYFAYPIKDGSSVLGAIVVKMRVGHLEQSWRAKDYEVIVVDPNGVIFLSSNPSWRFRSMERLSEDVRASLTASRQYSDRDLNPLSVSAKPTSSGTLMLLDIAPSVSGSQAKAEEAVEYLVQERHMPDAGWKIILLARTQDVAWQVNLATFVACLLLLSLFLAAMILYQRRKRIADRIAVQEAANTELERRVLERTAELTQTNLQLTNEVHERLRAENELRQTQSELVQATKLAALGQMSAGISHELNQPLAAIRTYADNARTFLERDNSPKALSNLLSISDLVERMARIISNLRTYARKETISLRPVSLDNAIDDALNLLAQRIRTEGVTIRYEPADKSVYVRGGDVRLQQVFVNLLSNAIDAITNAPQKIVSIETFRRDGKAVICLRDSGPGVPEDQLKNVFDPFYSTKDVGAGMGLGLSITYGIVKQFGGIIEAANHEDGGAVFTLTLMLAQQSEGEAA